MSDVGLALEQVWANGTNPQQIRRALQALATLMNESVQPKDDDLTAISDLTTTGILCRTSNSPETWVHRTITLSGGGSIANGGGVAGAPAITIHAQAHTLDGADHTAASDITTHNATTLIHGFCPKLSGSATTFLNGTGAWTSPLLVATQIGQVQYSTDGLTFTAQLPLTDEAGWLVEDSSGILLVVDTP